MPTDENNRIRITPDIIAVMRGHIERTGVWPATLLRGKRKELPEGLNSGHILGWMYGKTLTARKDYLDWVLEMWASLPDEADLYYRLTDEKRKKLKEKFKGVGLSPKRLFDGRQDAPEGFHWRRLHYILYQATKIGKDHYDYIMAVCESHQGVGYVEITQSIKEKIKSEIHRTGKSADTVLRLAGKKKPANITADKVRGWLKGNVRRAEKNVVDWLLEQFANYPDKVKTVRRRYKGKYDWISNDPDVSNHSPDTTSLKPITEKDLHLLQHYRQEYGLLPTKIFSEADASPPAGLNQYIVSNWLGGRTRRADPEYLEWVLKQCRKLEAAIKAQIRLESITLRKDIIALSAKTGISIDSAYEYLLKTGKKPDFTHAQFQQWVAGEVDLIRPEQIKPLVGYYIIKQQSPQPKKERDKSKKTTTNNNRSLTEFELKTLRFYRDEYGFLPGKIFKTVKVSPPPGLNPYKISSWLNGGTKTADPKLVNWVLKYCEEWEMARDK